MRRREKMIGDPEIIRKILEQSSICRIALSVDDETYIVPVNFGCKNMRLYIHSAPEGRKIEMIKKNNKVCFEMELEHEILKDKLACNWTTKYRSVIGYGDIFIVHDRLQKIEGLDVIMAKYGGPIQNYNDALLERMVLLVIDITSLEAKQSGAWDT